MIVRQEDTNMPLLDTLELHSAAALEVALGEVTLEQMQEAQDG